VVTRAEGTEKRCSERQTSLDDRGSPGNATSAARGLRRRVSRNGCADGPASGSDFNRIADGRRDCRKFWGLRATRAFSGLPLTWGESVAWMLRLVKIGTEGEGRSRDVMEIERPDDLADIADLGLTLSESKRLLATLQQEIVAAQVRNHAARRPTCSRCGGGCRVKDYQDHVVATLFGKVTIRFPAFAVRCVAGGSLASTGHRIAGRHRNWIGYRRISPPS